MRGIRTQALAMAIVAAAVSGCKKGNTYVQVQILPAANEPAGVITRIDLQMTLAGKDETKSFSEPGGAPITLPTSITLQVGSGAGQMAITAICLNAQNAEVDRGATTVEVKAAAIAQTSIQLPGGKPVIVPSEAQHTFLATPAGGQSGAVAITFQNTGFQPSGALTVALGGVGASQFTVASTTCTGTHLAPGASCTVTLVFQPVIAGAIAATLTVSGAPGGNTVVTLTGSGNPNPQSIAVSLTGNGQGTVTSNPAGLTCITGGCSGSYDYAATVSLTAVPATGSHFSGWTGGGCSGTGTCTLSMTQARSVSAQFDLDSEQLSLTISGTANVNSADGFITCDGTNGPGCISTYHYGDMVTLTATIPAGYHLVSWNDPACPDPTVPTVLAPSCTLSMTAAKSLALAFNPNAHTVTVTLGGSSSGSLVSGETPTPAINCSWTAPGPMTPSPCTAQYQFGDTISLTATPDTFSYISSAGITGDNGNTCTSGASPCTVNVGDSDIAINLTFDPVTLTINPNPGNGTGTLQCSVNGGPPGACATGPSYQNTDSVAITPTAHSPESTFAGWSGCDSVGGGPGNANCNVAMTKAQSVTPTFNIKTFTVTVAASGGGAGTVSGTGINCTASAGSTTGTCSTTVDFGSNLTLTAARTAGSMFTGWTSGCTGEGTCSLTNITANQTATSSFVVSLCSAATTVGQSFAGSNMQGCPAKITFPPAAGSCAATAHVCNANEWAQQNGGVAPTHHYWTSDALTFSSATGACGTTGCGSGNCFVSTGNTNSANCGATTPMRVCVGTGASSVSDPEGNLCNWSGCGFNSISPKQSFGGCGGNTTAGTLCCNNAVLHQYFASPGGSNAGTCPSTTPCRLTRALSLAVAGDTVFAAVGVYNSSTDTFPVTVKPGVNLIGDEPNRGPSTVITGQGIDPQNPGGPQPAVIAQTNSTVAGFTITGNYGLVVSGSGVTLRNNTFTGSSNDAIHLDASPHGAQASNILLNNITNNPAGIVYNGVTGKAENNTITNNGVAGVEVFTTAVDLGGGSSGSIGNNTFSCNRNSDFLASVASIPASNNRWDHATPATGPSGNGVDIALNGGSAVTTGATQAANPCPACAAGVSSTQTFDNTMIGCVAPISAGQPQVTFTNRATMCPSYCHACSAAEWNAHRGANVPNVNYWTGDLLNWNGGTVGPPGGTCAVSATSFTNPCGVGASMLVCPDTGTLCQGGLCGLDNTTNQHFGGCSSNTGANTTGFTIASGTLCCCP